MKKIYLSCFLLLALKTSFSQSNCSNQILNEEFSLANGWIETGDNEVQMINGELVLNNAHGGVQNYIYRELSQSVPTTMWDLKIDLTIDNVNASNSGAQCDIVSLSNGSANFFGSFSGGNYTDSNQDGIGVVIGSAINQGDMNAWYFRIETKKGQLRNQHLDSVIMLNSSVLNYFLELKRNSLGFVELSVFSDANRTVHMAGSPLSLSLDPAIVDLNFVQTGTYVPAYGTRTISATISNLEICSELAKIDDLVKEEIEIYPNPVESIFTIKNTNNIDKIEVKSLDGKLVEILTLDKMNVSNLVPGVYFVEVTFENGTTSSSKIIKN